MIASTSFQRRKFLHLSFYREVHDLLENGYLFLFNSDVGDVSVTRLRHRKNGRILTLKLRSDSWSICENGKVIKEVKPMV